MKSSNIIPRVDLVLNVNLSLLNLNILIAGIYFC